MNKIKIPKGWTFKYFKVDGEQTEFVYEDEFGDEHSYFDYEEHIPTYKELEYKYNKYKEVIDKIKEILFDKATFNLDDKYGKVFVEINELLEEIEWKTN